MNSYFKTNKRSLISAIPLIASLAAFTGFGQSLNLQGDPIDKGQLKKESATRTAATSEVAVAVAAARSENSGQEPRSPSGERAPEVKTALEAIVSLEVLYRVTQRRPGPADNAQRLQPLPLRDFHLDMVTAHLDFLDAQTQVLRQHGAVNGRVDDRIRELRKRILNWTR